MGRSGHDSSVSAGGWRWRRNLRETFQIRRKIRRKKKRIKKISAATQGPSFVFVKWMKHDLAGNPWEHYFPHWATKRICGFLNLRSSQTKCRTKKEGKNDENELWVFFVWKHNNACIFFVTIVIINVAALSINRKTTAFLPYLRRNYEG